MIINVGGEDISQNLTMTMLMDMSIDSVDDQGNYISTSTFTDVVMSSTDPSTNAALEQTSGYLTGMSVVSTFSASGSVLEQDYDIPESMPPEVAQAMKSSSNSINQTSLGFPIDNVGEGAQWQILSLTETQGMETSQRILCTLTEFDGQKGSVSASIEQIIQATEQLSEASIENFSSNGTMDYQFDLHNPSNSSIAMDMNTSFSITAGDQSQPFNMQIAINGALIE